MENEEQKQEEIVDQEVKEVAEEIQAEETKEDRPERNWKAELDRKNREIEKLRQEKENLKNNSVQVRDPNDLKTWPDHELKAIKYSNDPNFASLKDQAEDTLLERKYERMREKERMQEKRVYSEMELRKSYPDALNPDSELSAKIEEVMYEFDLQKSPAGRLAAAKIAAAELGKGSSKSEAKARKAEADRVARVKGNLVDGDRAKSAIGSDSDKKLEDAIKRANSKDINVSAKGFNEVLKAAGLGRDEFFKR